MKEELQKIKNEWKKEIEKLKNYESTTFFNSKENPYQKLTNKYQKKIKYVKKKYNKSTK